LRTVRKSFFGLPPCLCASVVNMPYFCESQTIFSVLSVLSVRCFRKTRRSRTVPKSFFGLPPCLRASAVNNHSSSPLRGGTAEFQKHHAGQPDPRLRRHRSFHLKVTFFAVAEVDA
jgi:hypothetical protein